LPGLCHKCGTALADRAAFCSGCGTPVEEGALPARLDNHNAVVAAARDADGRTRRFLLGLAVAGLGLILFVIALVFANPSSSPAPSPPTTIVQTPSDDKPADSVGRPSANTIAPATNVASNVTPEDRELREDGRVYSVAFVAARVNDNFVGEKLFAQGRLDSFDYASGMRSRPVAIIQDEQQPAKTLLCAMMEDEGAEVVSLYHVGEVVAVSGEYMGTAGLGGYPAMPLLRDCHVADRQDNVVRPAASPAPQLAGDDSTLPAQTATTPPLPDTSAGASVPASSTSATLQSDPAVAEQKPIPRVTYLAGECEDQRLNPDNTWNTNNPPDVICTAGVEDLATLRFYQLICYWGPADTSKWPRTPCSWPLPHEFNLLLTRERRIDFISGRGKQGRWDCGIDAGKTKVYGCLLLEGSVYFVTDPDRPYIGWGPPKK
jgi:hypothetical protein